ncbi:hypothetical protein Cni_G16174 [Canna indica]|uniref:Uncharacterized protein n=1 Tax=Canna indica TaxID=4628 RepID=A0AAQ3KI81_9LILI|nr:hypothetical protein Cni_G16174 [Canna indica]
MWRLRPCSPSRPRSRSPTGSALASPLTPLPPRVPPPAPSLSITFGLRSPKERLRFSSSSTPRTSPEAMMTAHHTLPFRPLSEKMMSGESVEEAPALAVCEELGKDDA